MGKPRSISSVFFTDEDVVSASFLARLLFIGIWTQADDDGLFIARPKILKMKVFPADNVDVSAALCELEKFNLIKRYDYDGSEYGIIQDFKKFQRHKNASRPHIPINIQAAVKSRDGECCVYCGDTEGPFHLDHIYPWSKGGEHSVDNLCVACAPCNCSKGDKTLQEWMESRNA